MTSSEKAKTPNSIYNKEFYQITIYTPLGFNPPPTLGGELNLKVAPWGAIQRAEGYKKKEDVTFFWHIFFFILSDFILLL